MVVKVYISGMSGNKEVKKRQQRVMLILDSKNVPYEVIDIAEPGAEDAKDFMQNNSTSLGGTISDPNPRHPLPPQIFNEDAYCGDYDAFDMANEIDEMEKFLKIESPETTSQPEEKIVNGEVAPEEKPTEESAPTNGETIEEKAEEKQEETEAAAGDENKDSEDTAKTTDEDKQEEKKNEEEDSGDTKQTEGGEEKQEEKPEGETEKADDDNEDFWGGKDD